MNDLYGIDPCSPDCALKLSSLMRNFGPADGRFIADFPMCWSQALLDHMQSISDLNQMRTVEALRQLKRAILPIKAIYSPGRSWSENAHAIRNEVKCLIGPSGKPNSVVASIDEILTDPNSFPDASGALIPRTIAAYVDAAMPLLQTSNKIVLIDPFFQLEYRDRYSGDLKRDQRWNFIVALLRAATQAKRVECFEIIHDPNRDKCMPIPLQVLAAAADSAGFPHKHLAIKTLDEKTGAIKQHARYLLGNASGLHFDHGFDLNGQGTNHVHWIGNAALKPLLEQFT